MWRGDPLLDVARGVHADKNYQAWLRNFGLTYRLNNPM
jgi:hypothetical protein